MPQTLLLLDCTQMHFISRIDSHVFDFVHDRSELFEVIQVGFDRPRNSCRLKAEFS